MITKAQLKHIRSLQQKKFRDLHGQFIAEGIHITEEAIRSGPDKVEMVVYTRNSFREISNLIGRIRERCLEVSVEEFSSLSTQKTPQQVLVILKKKETENPYPKENDLFLALDQIRDPGNLGTIIRLADWFGIRKLICSEDTVECYNPKVVQSSMGSILRVDISYTDLQEYLARVKETKGARLYGTLMEGNNIYGSPLPLPGIIILGNEAHGISAEIISLLDERITIPNFSTTPEKTESLNVAIAAAIACSEFRRRLP
ncbi:MAG: RNA methyltransferase [Bacteroidales bacterium]|nr:RNA methyltransferase [Bacteroidales bacterium]